MIDFARWLNPEFALWCDEQIENILRTKQAEFQLPTTFAEALRAYADEIDVHENTIRLLQDAKDLIKAFCLSVSKKINIKPTLNNKD